MLHHHQPLRYNRPFHFKPQHINAGFELAKIDGGFAARENGLTDFTVIEIVDAVITTARRLLYHRRAWFV